MLDLLYYRVRNALCNNDGVGVVELILIVVVLIGIVIIFKDNLQSVVESIFQTINSNIKNVG